MYNFFRPIAVLVAAGPQVLNDYNTSSCRAKRRRVAAGPQVLNDYNNCRGESVPE